MSTGASYTDARPLQVRIADDIRAKIEKGVLRPGEQLPTLDQIAGEYAVSLAASRKAVDLLRQQGQVVTIQGKGTFVRERPMSKRHGIDRYRRSSWKNGKPLHTAEAEAQGRTAGQRLRELGEVPAPDIVAEKFGIASGTTVWVRRRTTFIDDRPDQLADSYYELEVVDGTLIKQENTGPGGGFARLEDAGHILGRICEEWSVRMPTGPESIELRLPAGTPVVDLVRTTFDTTGRTVEVMLSTLAGDLVNFAYEFAVPD